jgi:hypothetical protein
MLGDLMRLLDAAPESEPQRPRGATPAPEAPR